MALYDANEMRIVDTAAPYVPASRYGAKPRVSWPAITVIAACHGLAFAAIDIVDVLPSRRAPSELKLIQLSPEMMPPPVAASPKPVVETRLVEARRIEPLAPIVDAPLPIVTVASTNPVAVNVAPTLPAPPPVSSGPVRMTDLDSKAVAVVAPAYPIESRRKREQGTVVLAVTLGLDGSVAAIDIARTSGFGRLDKAALDAVRRWRWSPTMRGGEPVPVTGTVDIPFVLQG